MLNVYITSSTSVKINGMWNEWKNGLQWSSVGLGRDELELNCPEVAAFHMYSPLLDNWVSDEIQRKRVKKYLFRAEASRLAVGPTHRYFQWLPMALLKPGVKLTTHPI